MDKIGLNWSKDQNKDHKSDNINLTKTNFKIDLKWTNNYEIHFIFGEIDWKQKCPPLLVSYDEAREEFSGFSSLRLFFLLRNFGFLFLHRRLPAAVGFSRRVSGELLNSNEWSHEM